MHINRILFLLWGILLSGQCLAVSEEEYLNNIDQFVESEAEKMDAQTDLAPRTTPAPAIKLKSRESAEAGREEFESYLLENHAGTYAFYKSLTDESKEAVYQKFSEGIPISKLRRMIIKLKINKQ